MGLFNLFKKEDKSVQTPKVEAVKPTVQDDEKKYYQSDSYYTDTVAEGTVFERKVVSFEDRKKTTIPSNRRLYPSEILLLSIAQREIILNLKMVIQDFGGLSMVFVI